MKGLEPKGLGQRVISALGLVLLVAVGTRLAADLLQPLIPAMVAIVSLGVIFRVVFGRR